MSGYFPSDRRTSPPELLRNRSGSLKQTVLYRSLPGSASLHEEL